MTDDEAHIAYLWAISNADGTAPFGMTAEGHHTQMVDYIAERLSAALGLKWSED